MYDKTARGDYTPRYSPFSCLHIPIKGSGETYLLIHLKNHICPDTSENEMWYMSGP